MATLNIIILNAGITTGVNLTANQAAQSTIIPVNSAGKTPLAVQLITNSLSGAHVKLTESTSVIATLNDLFVGTTPINLKTKGSQFLSWIADSATVTLNMGILEQY